MDMATAWNDMAETAAARANVYGLLATVFRAEPDEAFLDQLKDPGFSGALEALGLSLGDEFTNTPTVRLVEDMAVEYARLFIGPGSHISPHESVHVDVDAGSGGLWGAKTVEVKKFIEAAGFDYEDQFTGLPDHVSVELEFMQKLTEWESGKWACGDEEKAKYSRLIQRRFMKEHIMTWVPKLCDKVINMADKPFYEEMAKVTKRFLDYDKRSI